MNNRRALPGPRPQFRPVVLPRSAAVAASSPARAPASPPGAGITPGLILYAVGRWWRWATPVGVALALAASTTVWFLFVPMYKAVAWLKIEDHKPVLVFPNEHESPIFQRTQVELIKSPLVLSRVIGQAEVANLPEVRAQQSPVQWLTKHISVKSVGESELFQIIFEGTQPESAAVIVNGVLDSYMKVQAEMNDTQSQRTIELLEKEKERRAMDLDRLRKNLKTITRQASGKDPALIRENELVLKERSPLIELQNRLTDAEVEREVLEARHRAFEELTAKDRARTPESQVERAISESPAVKQLNETILASRTRLREAEAVATRGDQDPTVIRIRKEIAGHEQTLAHRRKELQTSLAKELDEVVQSEQQAVIGQLKTQIAGQRVLEQLLRERIDAERVEMEALGDHSLELEFARSELARAEDVFQRIADRAMALRTEMRAPARITLLERATPPDAPMEKERLMKLAAAGLGCLCFPFGLAVMYERRARRVADSQQIRSEAQLSVIAEITMLPMRAAREGRKASPRQQRLRSTFEESIDQLRTRLMLPDHLQDLRIIAVASAISGEGKTSLASQLSLSLARATREPVLLIDADLRAPDIHELFDVPRAPGLAEALDQKCLTKDAIVRSWSELVHLLPAGELHKNPHTLLTSETLNMVLEQVRAEYRYIVIDAPPLLAASEAFVVAKAADGTLLCAMRDVSRIPQVQTACERLVAAGATPLGVVLNGISASEYAHDYGSYDFETTAAGEGAGETRRGGDKERGRQGEGERGRGAHSY